jgi:acetyltransferase-like isoleucine patch superfamily enzyme
MENKFTEVIAEKNSPSDEEIICIKVFYKEGDQIFTGATLFELEGAKAIFEVASEFKGYFYPVITEGEKFSVGSIIGYISSEPVNNFLESIPKVNSTELVKDNSLALESIRYSQPALEYIKNVENQTKLLEKLGNYSGLVTLEMVKKVFGPSYDAKHEMSSEETYYWKNSISKSSAGTKCILIGAGRGAVQVLDLLESLGGFFPIGFISDLKENYLNPTNLAYMGDSSEKNITELIQKEKITKFILTVGTSPKFRVYIHELSLKLGIDLITLIHPSTVIGSNVTIGSGTLIFANVHIGTSAKIGNACFISSNSTIEHHNFIGDGFCTGPNLNTSGSVKIGSGVRFGMNIGVEPDVEIGDNSVIASGVILTKSIPNESVVKFKS